MNLLQLMLWFFLNIFLLQSSSYLHRFRNFKIFQFLKSMFFIIQFIKICHKSKIFFNLWHISYKIHFHELVEKLSKTKPMHPPPGKHIGLYTISIWYLTSPSPNQLQSTTPFWCEITPICDKLRYICFFSKRLQALENIGNTNVLTA